MQDLGTILIRNLIHGTFEGCAPSGECPRCDVVLQKLLVHNIDDSWNQSLDVLAARNERLDVI